MTVRSKSVADAPIDAQPSAFPGRHQSTRSAALSPVSALHSAVALERVELHKISSKSILFHELICLGPGSGKAGKLASRPTEEGSSAAICGRREGREPPRGPPAHRDEEGLGPGVDGAGPPWQPGTNDPLSLLGVGSAGPLSPAASTPASLDPLVSELLRSIAWGGDRRRGTARIELGSGRYGGTTLKVDVVDDGVRVVLEAPPGVDTEALGARLAERFEARGLRVDSLLVR